MMLHWGKIAIAVVGVAAAAIPARASDAFKYIPAKQVSADVADTSKGPAVKIYFNHDTFLEEIAARDQTGQVEIHKSWNDYMTALSGEAKLTVGGTPVGMKPTDPGEFRGDSITGGQTITLHPGDMVTIPAGMPHWLQLAPGAHFRYLVFKTKEPG
jgi:mannose-6-phosphate isomerase-like protein (cupin superfamily)